MITVPPLDNGINAEIREELQRADVYREGENLGDDPSVDGLIAVDPELLKHHLIDDAARQAGVDVLLHTYVVQTLTEGPAVTGVIVENKAGRTAILARVVVDATGDGDVAASAGAAFVQEEEPLPVTLMANLGGVDSARAIAALGNWGNLRGLIDEAVASGELDFDLEVHSKYFAPGVFAADFCHPGEIKPLAGQHVRDQRHRPGPAHQGGDRHPRPRAETGGLPHSGRRRDSSRRGSSTRQPRSACARRGRIVGGCSPTLREVLAGECADIGRQALREAAHAHPLRVLSSRRPSTVCSSPGVACRRSRMPWSSCA